MSSVSTIDWMMELDPGWPHWENLLEAQSEMSDVWMVDGTLGPDPGSIHWVHLLEAQGEMEWI
jgi:hypothetical protein